MDEEREISFRELFYHGLKKWRTILVIGLCISIVIGIYKGIGIFNIYNNEHSMEVAKNEYEISMQNFEAKGNGLENEIQNIIETQKSQKKYMNDSILMRINPYDEYVGTFSLYVDTDYKIMPNMVYQNVDKSSYIIDAYANYVASGELYSQIIEKYDGATEESYIEELISIERTNNLLTIKVKNTTKEECQKLVQLIKSGIEEKRSYIEGLLGDYDCSIINESVCSNVDLELDTLQKEKKTELTELTNAYTTKNKEYKKWVASPAPVFDYEKSNVVKMTVKSMVLSGAIACFLTFLWLVVNALITDTIISVNELKKRVNINILGQIPKNKRKNIFIDKRIRKLFHISEVEFNMQNACELVCSNIYASLDITKKGSYVLVGTLNQDNLVKLAANLKKCHIELDVSAAGNVLNLPEAIDKVKSSDGVILVETINNSTYTLLKEELDKMRMWNKDILGIIVNEAD